MKKISLIIPFMLLTPTLTSCNNNVDPFQIFSADKFNEAISFSDKNIKYVQTRRLLGLLYGSIYSIHYWEFLISPTVNAEYYRKVEMQQYDPDLKYYSHEGSKYYMYKKENEVWKKEDSRMEDFKLPSSFSIKHILDLGNVTYDSIKNHYDKERQAYYIDTEASGYPYSVSLAFYNNRLTCFSYEYYNEDSSRTEFGTDSYTYGSITPELPSVDNI